MSIRPFPGKSRYHSQEFVGGPITSLDQGYLVANVDGGARGNPGPSGYGVVIEDERIRGRVPEMATRARDSGGRHEVAHRDVELVGRNVR